MPSQGRGIEDVRLVQFTDDDGVKDYRGTYTAFNGTEVRQGLLRTQDFKSFELRGVRGKQVLSDAQRSAWPEQWCLPRLDRCQGAASRPTHLWGVAVRPLLARRGHFFRPFCLAIRPDGRIVRPGRFAVNG